MDQACLFLVVALMKITSQIYIKRRTAVVYYRVHEVLLIEVLRSILLLGTKLRWAFPSHCRIAHNLYFEGSPNKRRNV